MPALRERHPDRSFKELPQTDPSALQRHDTGELSLHESLLRELLQRAKGKPELAELFHEGCIALAHADEASRLPRGHEDRARAFSELLTLQRRLIDAVSLADFAAQGRSDPTER